MSLTREVRLPIRRGIPLLVLGCSKAKSSYDGSFVDVYKGSWSLVKRIGYPRSNLAAISGLYGYLSPGEKIKVYDHENKDPDHWHDHPTLWKFRDDVMFAGAAHLIAGRVYQAFGHCAEKKFPVLRGLITYSPTLTIGALRRHLQGWLIEERQNVRTR